MVPTDTLDRGGYMGGRCVALTWSSEIDGRPDWPSDHMPAPWPDVWFECSSLSTHCSKVRGSTSVGTNFAHTSTRPSVRTHRGRHPARSGRPRGARRKVAWFRTFTYVLGRSETSLVYWYLIPMLMPPRPRTSRLRSATDSSNSFLFIRPLLINPRTPSRI